jgi:hypothetical protein
LYPPHAYGGYERSCHAVVACWAASGHQVESLGLLEARHQAAIAYGPGPLEQGVLWVNL